MGYTRGKWYWDGLANLRVKEGQWYWDGLAILRAKEGLRDKHILYAHESGVSIEDMYLIVAAVNACIEINPDNPLAIAESIKDTYKALKRIMAKGLTSSSKRDGEIALAKAERK